MRIMVRIETLVSCMMDVCCKPIHQQYLLGKYHYEELNASLHDACSTFNSVYRITDCASSIERKEDSSCLEPIYIHQLHIAMLQRSMKRTSASESRNLNRVPFRNFGLPSYLGPTDPRVIANRVEPFSTTAFQAQPKVITMKPR